MTKNHYDILGISNDANDNEIKTAFRKQAIKFHPDKNSDSKESEEKFREITEAYETLKDETKRKKYDGQFVKRRKFKQGSNLKVSINVTRMELIQGIRKFIVIKRKGICKKCFGTGSANATLKKCLRCNGTGLQGFSLVLGSKRKCLYCKGLGRVPDGDKCEVCNGTTLIDEIIQHPLLLNPYIEVIKIPKLGNCFPGGSPGDLIVNLIIKEDPNYQVNGLNITRKIKISPAQAIIGDSFSLKVFRKNVQLQIPPGIQNGQEIELKNKGITYKKETGYFRVTIYIKIPLIITEKEKYLYHELFKLEKETSCQVKVLNF